MTDAGRLSDFLPILGIAAAAAVAEGRANTVSAYVAEALAEKAAGETMETFLADWRHRVGAPTAEETAWADRALGGGSAAST